MPLFVSKALVALALFRPGHWVTNKATGNRGVIVSVHPSRNTFFYCVQPIDFVEEGVDGWFESELNMFIFKHHSPHPKNDDRSVKKRKSLSSNLI